jgi:hypothetical protein
MRVPARMTERMGIGSPVFGLFSPEQRDERYMVRTHDVSPRSAKIALEAKRKEAIAPGRLSPHQPPKRDHVK